jgi:hypothetical protein
MNFARYIQFHAIFRKTGKRGKQIVPTRELAQGADKRAREMLTGRTDVATLMRVFSPKRSKLETMTNGTDGPHVSKRIKTREKEWLVHIAN